MHLALLIAPLVVFHGGDKVTVTTLKKGNGVAARKGDRIFVDYTGSLANGKVFDTSKGRGPFDFVLGDGQVIQGWDQGLIGSKVGSKLRLRIPPSLGYGAQGAAGVIPPNATLVFVVDVRRIERGAVR